ncbi:MAG TPA: hypothetical protein VMJ32_02235 [Pirellulales bacterium]|nr:hypothetical protein [Pirellulales bacterium]
MPFELQYTSAPHGLLPGQSGLATVKMTKGMPLQLRESLETLSSYHGASIEHASSKQFQCSSLLHFAAAGTRWYVLSRSANAGLDYTHRQTFFVHHVAFSPEETAGLDPLSLLNAADFLRSRWDGRVEEIAAPPRIPHPAQPGAKLNGPLTAEWKAFIVDEALAGKLIYLITPENSSLSLAESLLAAATQRERWNVTFMTRFQSLSPTVKCAVRCLAPGAPLPAQLDRSQATVVDATGPLGPAPPGRVVASQQSVPEARAMVPAVTAASIPRPTHRQPSMTTAEERWQSEAAEFVRPNRRSTPTESPAGYSFGQGIALGAVATLAICMGLAAIIILSLQSRIAERDQTINDKTTDYAKLQTELSTAESQQKTTAAELDSLKNTTTQQLHLLDSNKQTLNETIDSLENKLKERDATITGLNKQNDEQKASINSLQADINSLKTEKEQLAQQLKDELAKQKTNQPDKGQTVADSGKAPVPPPTPTPTPRSLIPDVSVGNSSVIDVPNAPPNASILKLDLTGVSDPFTSKAIEFGKIVKCFLSAPGPGKPASPNGVELATFTTQKNKVSVTFTWSDGVKFLNDAQKAAIKGQLDNATLKVTYEGGEEKTVPLSGQK